MLASTARDALTALLFSLVLAAGMPSLVAAQEVAGSDAEARALFQAATVAFDEGRYESALEYFERAYELSHRAELLYNIGVTAERLRRDAAALDAFRRFLAAVPDTSRRSGVEARIAILERAVSREGEDADPETDPDPSASSGSDSTGPIVLMIAGGVLAVGGAVMVGIAAADVASVEGASRGTAWESVADAYDRSEPLSIAGFVSLGVGVALVAGGAIWLAVGGSGTEQATLRIVPALGPTLVGLAAGGTF